jgi:hypothetical protein
MGDALMPLLVLPALWGCYGGGSPQRVDMSPQECADYPLPKASSPKHRNLNPCR